MSTPSSSLTGSDAAPQEDAVSLPLSPRAASMLAYSAGWLSGALVLSLEGRRAGVRRHAAQAFVGFGILTLVALVLLAAAGLGLFVSIGLFRVLLWMTQGVVLVGVGCWVLALVQTARGVDWRWPWVSGWAERLARLGNAR